LAIFWWPVVFQGCRAVWLPQQASSDSGDRLSWSEGTDRFIHGEVFMRPIIKRITILTLATGIFPGALAAQTTSAPLSNFSGVWRMDNARSESAMQDQPVEDVIVSITQTGSMLRVETSRDGKREIAIYPFVARPSDTGELSGIPRAFWEGPILVDEGSLDVNGKTIGFRETRTAASDGSEMVVETTLKVEHGYDAKGAQTIVSGKNVFMRRR
jgi:hypothetical protein